MNVIDRFLKYVSFDTISDQNSTEYPSTAHQKILGQALVDEMKAMGINDANMDKYGYVTGTIPSNAAGNPPVLAFCAHMDTSPDISGKDIKAKRIKYAGGDIVLNEKLDIVMRASEFESLGRNIGKELIVTDGTTLLGADDKAGIAEIMALAEHLLKNPDVKHGTVKLLFTPDEEVGTGTKFFDVKSFGADACYTVDGGSVGELQYENFNACSVVVDVNGVNIHPGSAKNKMLNSISIGMEFNSMLPIYETPENTCGYEGFYHLTGISGDVEKTSVHYIVRDHSREKFDEKKRTLEKIGAYMNDKYGKGTVTVTIRDSYANMKEALLKSWHVVENAQKAMEELGITPISTPIRGGTDGSALTYMGLPCPNLGTGGQNYHGRYEYAVVEEMELSAKILLKITELYGKM